MLYEKFLLTKTLLDKQTLFGNVYEKFQNIMTSSFSGLDQINAQTCFFRNKFQMFDQQCFIVWLGPKTLWTWILNRRLSRTERTSKSKLFLTLLSEKFTQPSIDDTCNPFEIAVRTSLCSFDLALLLHISFSSLWKILWWWLLHCCKGLYKTIYYNSYCVLSEVWASSLSVTRAYNHRHNFCHKWASLWSEKSLPPYINVVSLLLRIHASSTPKTTQQHWYLGERGKNNLFSACDIIFWL